MGNVLPENILTSVRLRALDQYRKAHETDWADH